MTTELHDGTIVPSYYDVITNHMEPLQGDMFLRTGVIVAQHNPTDASNISKRFIEYDVQVSYLQNNTFSLITYSRCYIYDLFGSKADFVEYTLRPSSLKNQTQQPQQNQIDLGSNVLLLCINGIKNQGIILGGIKNAQKPKENPSLGHHFTWNFNGINANVNKDGELTITFNGATNSDGSLSSNANSDASGTFLKIDKNGVIALSSQNGNCSITIDRNNDTIEIEGDGGIQITSDNNIVTQSKAVLIGEATDNMMLGTSYRGNESTMNNQLVSLLSSIANSLGFIAGGIGEAATALGANPTTAAAAPGLTIAATSFATSGPLFQQMAQAIQQFEAGARSYLSTINKND